MKYHEFRRFMWFPLLRRFLWAFSAFKYAWRNIHPTNHWASGYHVWVNHTNMDFKVGDFDYIRGREPMKGKVLPYGLEPFMLKKRCINANGDVRFFDAVPSGWNQVDPRDYGKL